MKGVKRLSQRIRIRFVFHLALILLGLGIVSPGQERPATDRGETSSDGNEKSNFAISVNVNEVRLDAVVLDGKQRQITDLTADDFEIYQDGVLQEINSCMYISNQKTQPGIASIPRPGSGTAPPGVHALADA